MKVKRKQKMRKKKKIMIYHLMMKNKIWKNRRITNKNKNKNPKHKCHQKNLTPNKNLHLRFLKILIILKNLFHKSLKKIKNPNRSHRHRFLIKIWKKNKNLKVNFPKNSQNKIRNSNLLIIKTQLRVGNNKRKIIKTRTNSKKQIKLLLTISKLKNRSKDHLNKQIRNRIKIKRINLLIIILKIKIKKSKNSKRNSLKHNSKLSKTPKRIRNIHQLLRLQIIMQR